MPFPFLLQNNVKCENFFYCPYIRHGPKMNLTKLLAGEINQIDCIYLSCRKEVLLRRENKCYGVMKSNTVI